MKNYKTTVAGIATLLAIVSKSLVAGHFDFNTDAPAAMAAIGLLFSKDYNVTGGSVQQ